MKTPLNVTESCHDAAARALRFQLLSRSAAAGPHNRSSVSTPCSYRPLHSQTKSSIRLVDEDLQYGADQSVMSRQTRMSKALNVVHQIRCASSAETKRPPQPGKTPPAAFVKKPVQLSQPPLSPPTVQPLIVPSSGANVDAVDVPIITFKSSEFKLPKPLYEFADHKSYRSLYARYDDERNIDLRELKVNQPARKTFREILFHMSDDTKFGWIVLAIGAFLWTMYEVIRDRKQREGRNRGEVSEQTPLELPGSPAATAAATTPDNATDNSDESDKIAPDTPNTRTTGLTQPTADSQTQSVESLAEVLNPTAEDDVQVASITPYSSDTIAKPIINSIEQQQEQSKTTLAEQDKPQSSGTSTPTSSSSSSSSTSKNWWKFW